MTVFGVSMFKDEEDIILPVVQHMLTQVDHVLIADNLSTDKSRELLESIDSDRLTIVEDNDPAYYQSIKMTALAERARALGAKWIIPFDADEVWYSPFGRIADVLTALAPLTTVAEATLYDHVPTAIDPEDTNPLTRIGWRRRNPGPLAKVACRANEWLTINQGNHSASYAHCEPVVEHNVLVIRHFPYRTGEQMVKKAVNGATALNFTNLPFHSGAHWRGYADIVKTSGGEALKEVFYKYFWCQDPTVEEELIFDPAPVTS